VKRLKNSFFAGARVKPRWVRRGREWVRRVIELAARIEPIRRVLFELQHKISMHMYPVHPFDEQYGIRTSGFLPGSVLRSGYSVKKTTLNAGYLGEQPSIVRRPLKVLPSQNDATFLDLGCGKGRALVVASEFPFRSVIGVEISPELAKVAKENARVIARNFPERTPIAVVNGDALDYALPEGNLIAFLYNPFGEDLITRLLTNIETALLTRDSSIWVVYTNPVWGHILDRSSTLTRIYAESVPYDPGEIGFGPDSSEVVVIWQDAKNAPVNASSGLDRGIVVINGQRAEFADKFSHPSQTRDAQRNDQPDL
jgi:SAM-dependent methyltransferase